MSKKESLKYEYRIQKNAQRRMSQITNEVTDFIFEDENAPKSELDKEKSNESNKIILSNSIKKEKRKLKIILVLN